MMINESKYDSVWEVFEPKASCLVDELLELQVGSLCSNVKLESVVDSLRPPSTRGRHTK